MLVNFQLPTVIYPPFTLVINRYGVESTYTCTRTKGFLRGMTCSGAPQTPGEILQFKVFAKNDGTLIAEGKFPIIGIAISTPEITHHHADPHCRPHGVSSGTDSLPHGDLPNPRGPNT